MDFAAFMAQLPEPHTIVVEPYTGSGAYGDVYGTAVTVTPCYVDATRRRVRVTTQDAAGHEVVSSAQVYCLPDTVAPAGSRVTLPSGAITKVLDVADLDSAGLGLCDHVELVLE